MIKNVLIAVIMCILCSSQVFADTSQQPANASFYSDSQPIPVDYAYCVRDYQIPAKELFQRTLSAISSSNYKIIEIQSKSSRVLFSVFGREFWASVTKQNSGAATLRILPADNSFYFQKTLIDRIFNEIDAYKTEKIIQVNK